MRNKKDKIDFLKGLMTGVRKLNELQPTRTYCFIQDLKNPDLFKSKEPELILTRAQLDTFMEQHPNSRFITFVAAGTRPRPGAIHIDFNLAS